MTETLHGATKAEQDEATIQRLTVELAQARAERDALRGHLDELRAGKGWDALTEQVKANRSERDALAAQVAALVAWLEDAEHWVDCSVWYVDGSGDRCMSSSARCTCGLTDLESNLPDAAARYLAADRFAAEADGWLSEGQLASSQELRAARAAYRKACGQGGEVTG